MEALKISLLVYGITALIAFGGAALIHLLTFILRKFSLQLSPLELLPPAKPAVEPASAGDIAVAVAIAAATEAMRRAKQTGTECES